MAVIFGPTRWQETASIGSRLLGSSIAGGRLICKSGGVAWIVAPSTTEVSRNWFFINDAVTTAQSITGCTGWFVPTYVQLQNPGYICRTYWDSYSTNSYWTSTETTPTANAFRFSINGGPIPDGGGDADNKNDTYCVRAFRCVTY